MKKTIHSEQSRKLCALLVKARKDAGMTQTALAVALGKPQSFVAKYELGERRLDLIEFLAVCRILKVDPLKIVKNLLK